MKTKNYLSLILGMLLVFGILMSGCSKTSDVNRNDLKLVNAYIKEVGAEEIPFDVANDMNKWLEQHSETLEIKTQWQLVVYYVRNERSEDPVALDYTIEFYKDSFTMKSENTWEDIGG